MNRKILNLAIPNIITNITVPLLGMVDTAIVGHLSETHLGAVAIGTQIFNLIYWNFGFLRMGTSGFTAQAYGSRRLDEAVRVFLRAFAIAIAIAILLLILQIPLARLSAVIFNGSNDVINLALSYFYIRIWAAPATLSLYAIKGWFIGMQNSRLPMWMAIFINIVNIACSLLFVIVLGWDIKGVALGTVIAQYSGMAVGLWFVVARYGKIFRKRLSSSFIRQTLHWNEMKQFFRVNGDIFLRTICLAAVFTFITSESGRISDRILAVDALLLQFFTLFSYIMDGFAYAGESLVGRYIGAGNRRSLISAVRHLLAWGMALTVLFTLLYAAFGESILTIFSDKEHIIEATKPYLFWTLVIPVCGFAAFLFDGIFIGATASRTMRDTMFIATAAFFLAYYGLRTFFSSSANGQEQLLNNILWTAFMIYLLLRGVGLALMLRRSVYSKADITK